MRAVPTFEDFWMTCATERAPWGWASLIDQPPITSGPADGRVGLHDPVLERGGDGGASW
jgi:hypothetical protein